MKKINSQKSLSASMYLVLKTIKIKNIEGNQYENKICYISASNVQQ